MAAQDTAIKQDPHIGKDFLIHDIDAEIYHPVLLGGGLRALPEVATPALSRSVLTGCRSKGVEVLSVHVINSIEGKELWVDFVNEHQLFTTGSTAGAPTATTSG
jgi:hypothetical protein